ncbi:CHASE2 domain-containing protein [Pseudoduganella albidiflava]|uniref:Adenylate/guanylate cyclase domain-containing protein n=1 Tax=Pseudoduganella albidiflava TaxID=321983 RepID=A0A411WT14_9BURK|nr:adenylate/guanylate cyclase domain-containing protein [Pseudoduganella albidiflava]QBH99934.1 adenylate/guanylate cyclase domain-containing protein [Pseudoduganella albidiflava]GGY54979.1 adenylate/guanylate cyclase domain-containing protein [Pseudoduganella albidiflava]
MNQHPALRALFSSATLLGIGIPACAVLLTVLLQGAGSASPASVADELLRDRIVQLRASDSPEQRMVVVDIDEETLERHPWPWQRTRMAELVERLFELGASGVALDIVMLKPGDAEGDLRMAMLAQHAPLVLAQLFDYNAAREPLRSGVLAGGRPGPRVPGAIAATGYLANHAGLAGARHAGNIGVTPDPDGVLRRVPMTAWFEGRNYPSLALALMHCCGGGAPATEPLMRVPFTRTPQAYHRVVADDLLQGRIDEATVRGKLVLVGSSALSVGDRIATPMGASFAGLLVHASILTGLLDRRDGLAPATWPGAVIATLFCIAVAVAGAYTFPRLAAAYNVLLLAAMAVLWLALAYAIVPHDPDFAPAAPLFSILFLLAVSVPFHWQLAQQNSRRLLGTLRQYVATSVVTELLRSNLKDPLAPRQCEVTTLIADMEGYTSQVESLPVEEAARLTSDFLDCLTRPVIGHHGTLDKYTGDGLVAFWGAPLPNAAHADLALDAARDILREVARLSQARMKQGHPPLRVRIGIESGPAMAGDYGSSLRSIYTAVGDSVNTAARLEQAARDWPHDVIIGEGTVQRARRHRFLSLGETRLRGKEKAVQLYTLEPAA